MEERVQEYILFNSTELTDDGVIHDVAILGVESKNGRVYEEAALKASVELFNRVPVYTNHSTNSRKIDEKLGVLEGVRYAPEHKQLRGNLNLLTTHDLYPRIKEDVSRGLGLFGLSIDGFVAGERRDDKIHINKINRLFSVDVVSDPATVKNFKEEIESVDYEALITEELNKILPELVTNTVKAVVEEKITEELSKIGKTEYGVEETEEKEHFALPTNSKEARRTLLTL